MGTMTDVQRPAELLIGDEREILANLLDWHRATLLWKCGGLDESAVAGGQVNARYIGWHMVQEYARHNGHADLLRESIDGAVGQ
jgi:Protein of unknown function (DUF664)